MPDTPTRLPGVDVSHHQGRIDWAVMADRGVRFAALKATEGLAFRDPEYAHNLAGARAHGIIPGAYHLIHPDQRIVDQVDHYSAVASDMGRGCLPPIIDVETAQIDRVDPATARGRVLSACWMLEHRWGVAPILYISSRGVRHLRGHVSGLEEFPLWLCSYTRTPRVPPPWTAWTLWQYSDQGDGHAHGCESSRIDLNWFNGDSSALARLTGWERRRLEAPTTRENELSAALRVWRALPATERAAVLEQLKHPVARAVLGAASGG